LFINISLFIDQGHIHRYLGLNAYLYCERLSFDDYK